MTIKTLLKERLLERLVDRDHRLATVPGDRLIASFPKSGNTWLQWILFFLYNDPDEASLPSINQFSEDNPNLCIVESYYRRDSEIARLRATHKAVVIKTHSIFRPKFADCRTLYIVRDPRDVALSYHAYYTKLLGRDVAFDEFIERYIAGRVHPLFGSWAHHAGSWWGAMNGDEAHFLLIRYEDLLDDPLPLVARICDFLGLDRDETRIMRAVERASFGRLKKREEAMRGTTSGEPMFFRKGTKGEWRTALPEAERARIEARFGPMMSALGYL